MSASSAPRTIRPPASLWIWLSGTALLTLPAIGNFFQYGL